MRNCTQRATRAARVATIVAIACVLATLVSCGGPRLSGTYSGGGMVLTFASGEKVSIGTSVLPGVGVECEYKIEGDKLKISSAQSPEYSYVMTIQKDGSILGPMDTVLTKEAKASGDANTAKK